MDDRIKVLPDLIPDIKFNLKPQEQFVTDKGIVLTHWAAMPSPIGLKDRGEYRRSDAIDTISSNGFIYRKVGEFIGVIVGNQHSSQAIEGGIYDNSTARLILPKYYSQVCDGSEGKEIQLLPGDRLYAKDIELKVQNYQRAEYNSSGIDRMQFPVKCVSMLLDSQNVDYQAGRHFSLNTDGNIEWIAGQKNPGIDPETGKGRVYSIRYTYNAFWYVHQILNEIRVTNTEGSDKPERMPYHAVIQREYCYYNQTKGDPKESTNQKTTDRTVEKPKESISPNQYQVKVDIKNFE